MSRVPERDSDRCHAVCALHAAGDGKGGLETTAYLVGPDPVPLPIWFAAAVDLPLCYSVWPLCCVPPPFKRTPLRRTPLRRLPVDQPLPRRKRRALPCLPLMPVRSEPAFTAIRRWDSSARFLQGGYCAPKR